MGFTERYSHVFRLLLPSPFSIAILLTVFTYLIAYFFTSPASEDASHALTLLGYWENGLWNNGLMVFAMQMMLMLVLGHTLALTPVIDRLIQSALSLCTNTAKAAFFVTLLTILVAYFNWGLGLIFGAIFARKVAEYSLSKGFPLNYPLIGAAGYSGLMVWHGGLSGSSLTKVAESGHLSSIMEGVITPDKMHLLPAQIGFDKTVFSTMNIVATICVIIILPTLMYLIGKKSAKNDVHIEIQPTKPKSVTNQVIGMEFMDQKTWVGIVIGLVIVLYACIIGFEHSTSLSFITPNFINLSLLGLALLLHRRIKSFLSAIDEAIGGAAGILIQFPLYFGIMGIMKDSGLIHMLSDFFIGIADATSFPIFTFLSVGLVNIFVPSGGGQWAVQGPILIQTALELKIPLEKCIMALAYGDQLTNMLQPFWALPLLGITGLKAKEIVPYTLILMLAGTLIFTAVLLLF